MAKCKSCNAKIIWMKTQGGSKIPVDWDQEIETETIFDPKTMVYHFETCRDAKNGGRGDEPI